MTTNFKKENDMKDTTAKTHRSRDNKQIPTADYQKSNKKTQIEHDQKEMFTNPSRWYGKEKILQMSNK